MKQNLKDNLSREIENFVEVHFFKLRVIYMQLYRAC